MSLKLRITLLVTAALLLVTLCQLITQQWSQQISDERFQTATLTGKQALWRKIIDGEIQAMLAEAGNISRDRIALKALRKGDLDTMQANFITTYNRLSISNVLEKIVIVDAQNTIIFSAPDEHLIQQSNHNPLVSQVIADGKIHSGLAYGENNTLLLEVLFPIYYRGKVVGITIFARSLQMAVDEFKAMSGADTFVVDFNNRTAAATNPLLLDQLDLKLENNATKYVTDHAIDDQYHLLSITPITDASGHDTAHLITLDDNHDTYLQQQKLTQLRWLILFLVLVSAIVLIYILINKAFSPMRIAIDTLRDIANGDLNTQQWQGHWKGEFAELMSELGTAQERLLAFVESEQKSAQINSRIRQALDNVSVGVMVGDQTHKIIYHNTAFHTLMQASEGTIRQLYPGFDCHSLKGQSICLFPNQSHELTQQLDSLSHTQDYEIQLNDITLRMVVTPVTNENNQRIGTVIEWNDRTQELGVEVELHKLVTSALAGDLSHRISLENKHGFFLALSESMNRLIDVNAQVINDTVRVVGALARGDLREKITRDYQGEFERLKTDANATTQQLSNVVAEIHHAADAVLNGVREITDANHSLSERTEQQAANLEQTSAAMEELTSAVQSNADSAINANKMVTHARDMANRGCHVVENTVAAIGDINDASNHIADIIGVIDEIAFQTNLLALNASVEAARAGDQGRGFAVVASEVRNLAQRSANSAKEIKDLIADSVTKVEEGVRLADESGSTLKDIAEAVERVSAIVAEIAGSSSEQSDGIRQINAAITQLDGMTQQNSAMVEEAASVSEVINQQAKGMLERLSFFRFDP